MFLLNNWEHVSDEEAVIGSITDKDEREDVICNVAHSSMSLKLRHFDVNICLLEKYFCEQNTFCITVLNNAAVLTYFPLFTACSVF